MFAGPNAGVGMLAANSGCFPYFDHGNKFTGALPGVHL